MKFTSTTQYLGPLRTVTLPVAKWELVRRALGPAGYDLGEILGGDVFSRASAGCSTVDLPVLGGSVQREARACAHYFLATEYSPVEHDIEIGGTINDHWVVLAVGQDWVTVRDTTDGQVAVWVQDEVHAYIPPPVEVLYG